MKIAILGAGNIGGTLGKKWIAAGHEVRFGVRDAESPKTKKSLDEAKGAIAVGISEAIAFADVVLVSTPWATVPEIALANAGLLEGKIIFDATNNFAGPIINNIAVLQNAAPTAKIFRAFNSLGWEVFAQPIFDGQQAEMFYTGPEGEARVLTHRLIDEIGVKPVWAGENDRVHLVDAIGALWVTMVFQRGWKRRWAFKVLTE